jgi:LysR family transcriptional regulator for bpeEF and oprC
MDKLTAMRAFLRVVDAGTFTKAAALLDVPVPTVTRLVQALEAELKTQLLTRTTRRVSLTPAGADYAQRARQLLNDLDEIEGVMAYAGASPRGRIRVDIGSALARLVIAPALPDFVARYPDISIDLGGSDRMVDLVAEHVDCAVRTGRITDASLVARQIGELHYVCCASPAYLARCGVPAQPSDLDRPEHSVISYFNARATGAPTFGFRKDGRRLDIHGHSQLAVNDANVALAACLAGLGVMRAPLYLVQHELDGGRLVPVLSDWFIEPLPIQIVYPPNRYQSHRVRVFVDWVVALFAATPAVRRRGDSAPLSRQVP